jgi:hypothetical protein
MTYHEMSIRQSDIGIPPRMPAVATWTLMWTMPVAASFVSPEIALAFTVAGYDNLC